MTPRTPARERAQGAAADRNAQEGACRAQECPSGIDPLVPAGGEVLARITVAWDPMRTSDNRTRRLHWAAKGQLNRTAKSLARAAWLQAGSPVSAGRVRASFIIRRGRAMDPLNAAGGLKSVVDGIFVGALTPDDSAEWLELGGVTVEVGREWAGRNAEVVVIVEAA